VGLLLNDYPKLWDVINYFGILAGGGCTFLFYSTLFAAIAIPGQLTARPRTRFLYCTNELKNISIALHKEIEDTGDLKHINSIRGVCHHNIPGANKTYDCLDLIEKFCTTGSFKFKKIDNMKYELKAESIDPLQCKICVTESAARPWKYTKKGCREFQCIHEDKN
jgi:hypothetical protein